ncbi:ABC transporter ATP-binding protein [Taylorella equigenitalis]|uniref:ABC transporter ATP-binding protein n=1 Tax=Taylorella equigenitalis TaxID=29575 RepID=UPI0023B0456B|nr:ABC transporter ATP-binding protein [Taylorella equigenitalis]WEE01052.1 ABC transporter ATP-binding protein [Taylorella equigenitalis]WEE02530.1 ABC transporter ATP-binding protein [Taylorella equigenitalis]WFD79070.1 ABC transporter ATP-binding protein [Taylorella equigenitalis]WFD80543.1 ABC transporter ATP-binding protein [Taylorella equigenitalis]WFD82022.1 ABC transporter ATP-binding protein [Taylorella equigenitalis]
MGIYKRLIGYVQEYKLFLYISIFLSILSACITVIGYLYIYKFLDSVIIHSEYSVAQTYAIYFLIALVIAGFTYFGSGFYSHKLGFRLESNLRKKGLENLTDASFRFFDLNPSGTIRKTIDDNASNTHNAVAHLIPDTSQALLIPISSIVLAFYVSLETGLVILGLTITIGLLLKFMMGDGHFMKLYQDSLQKMSAETTEFVRGIPVIKIFSVQLDTLKDLHKSITDYSNYAYSYSESCKTPYTVYQLILMGLVAILIIPISIFIDDISNPLQIAVDLIMITFLSGVIMVSFMKIMWMNMHLFNAKFALDSLENLFVGMNSDKLTYGIETEFSNYDIEMQDVSFSYNENKVIENLSFKFEEGKKYALIGHSGSGKSTIAKLLSGFYKVDSGVINIGGKPLESYTKEAIANAITFVFQNSKLFKISIYDNVALADKNASHEEVMQALSQAGCDVILDKFIQRENTIIGAKGVYLSGGEIQRISIARAILKKAKIVILDEACASIDADNEHELQIAYKNLMKDKTVIMIAHRLSSIKSVDEIIVLENGKIIETGNHNKLSEKDSKYNFLQNLYSSANKWRVK